MRLQQRNQTTGSVLFCSLTSDKALCEIALKGVCVQPTGSNYLGRVSILTVICLKMADVEFMHHGANAPRTVLTMDVETVRLIWNVVG